MGEHGSPWILKIKESGGECGQERERAVGWDGSGEGTAGSSAGIRGFGVSAET